MSSLQTIVDYTASAYINLYFFPPLLCAGAWVSRLWSGAGLHGGGVRWQQGTVPPSEAAEQEFSLHRYHREGPQPGQLTDRERQAGQPGHGGRG